MCLALCKQRAVESWVDATDFRSAVACLIIHCLFAADSPGVVQRLHTLSQASV
jgi:hypothetical protein